MFPDPFTVSKLRLSSLLQFCPITFLGLQTLSLTSEVVHLPVLPLRSASSHDTLPASVLNNHISPLDYDVALILRHN